MRNARQRFHLVIGVLLTVSMLFFAILKGFMAGYLLAFVGIVIVAAALVNLKRVPRK